MANNDAEPLGPAGSSGYVYTDLNELDEVIGGWRTQRDDLDSDATLLIDAFPSHELASDPVTTDYSSLLTTAIHEFFKHTYHTSQYVDDYATKLAASRQVMTSVEDENAAKFSSGGGV